MTNDKLLSRRRLITGSITTFITTALTNRTANSQVAPAEKPHGAPLLGDIGDLFTSNEFRKVVINPPQSGRTHNLVTPEKLSTLTQKSPRTMLGYPSLRGLWLINANTGDEMTTVFWDDNNYNHEELSKLSWMLRDWRENQIEPIDPTLYHLLWAIQHRIEFKQPIYVTSGYRTPTTNNLLRAEGASVNSLHMKGKAVDIVIKNMEQTEIARHAHSLGKGGVGFYRRFTHIDTGPPRTWGTS